MHGCNFDYAIVPQKQWTQLSVYQKTGGTMRALVQENAMMKEGERRQIKGEKAVYDRYQRPLEEWTH
jgi:hypothetical protein